MRKQVHSYVVDCHCESALRTDSAYNARPSEDLLGRIFGVEVGKPFRPRLAILLVHVCVTHVGGVALVTASQGCSRIWWWVFKLRCSSLCQLQLDQTVGAARNASMVRNSWLEKMLSWCSIVRVGD